MLPPDRTHTTGPSNLPGFSMMAATPAPPDGSTSILARSSSMTSDWLSASSLTVMTSLQSSAMTANGTSPGIDTAMPSAIVWSITTSTGRPSLSDGAYDDAPSA